MPRTCAVTSCRNSETKLRKWGAEICERHHIAQRSCDCGWPYELRPFPAAKKEHVLREEWIKQMHRKDPASSYKRWEPNNESRVCSLHFIPGGTIPTLDLGHNRKQVKERSLPRRRCNSHNIFQHHTKKEKHVDLEPAATSQPNCDEPAGQTTATPPSSPDAPAGGSPVAQAPASPDATAAQAPASPDATAAQAPAFPDATAAQVPASPDATAAQAPASPDATAAPDTQAASPNCDHNYAYSSVCFANCACKCCDEKDKVIVELKRKLFAVSAALEVLENELCSTQEKVLKNNHIPWTQFVKNNKAVRQNTGFPSKQLLDRVFTSLQSKARRMRYWQGAKRTQVCVSTKARRKFAGTPRKPGPNRKLPLKAEFVMTMVKLRQGLSTDFLSGLFGVSISTCSTTITTWLRFMSEQMKSLVNWPDIFATRQSIPAGMAEKYPRLRCTMDCAEVFLERPSHLEIQAKTYSQYKSHNTVKFLVCIAPNGHISFLSEVWGGRASDRAITLDSGVLDKLDRGDTVLVDRGFTIKSDLLVRGVNLEMPPPASGLGQMTRSDVAKTKKVANARIHVERAIGRMKWFRILTCVLPVNLLPVIDDIVVVCAAVCNLHPALVK